MSKSSIFFALGFIAYLLALTVPIVTSNFLAGGQFYDAANAVFFVGTILFFTASGVFIAMGALASKAASNGRRIVGALLAFGFLIVPLFYLVSLVWGLYIGGRLEVIGINLISVGLFISWGVSRPFRGLGYLGLLFGVILSPLPVIVGYAMWAENPFLVLLSMVAACIPPTVAVLTARAFEKSQSRAVAHAATAGTQAPVGYYGSPTAVSRTNSLALMSLIFSVVGVGLVGLILGHVARSQIRRTGEQGASLALAGLIVGYLQVALLVIAGIIFLIVAMINFR